ncbi:MAG: T9SS type A sorting domain-containing protein [Ignavibacteria bacterium]|nr:T9SS type A sorting domain-containing protein [Ignavibacteria bacterium]
MLTKSIFIFLILMSLNSEIQSQWIKYNAINSNSLDLTDIQFVNENTGFAVGGFPSDTIFLKTTNAGLNWSRYYINSGDSAFITYYNSIYFIDENLGFLCGGGKYIFKSTNGGINWNGISVPFLGPSQTYNDIQFVNSTTGYAIGRYGYLIKTTNNGESWDSIYKAINDLHCLQFIDEKIGFIADVNNNFYSTTNSGMNWTIKKINFNYSPFSISFIDRNTGFLAGYNANFQRALLKTTNGGENWAIVLSGTGWFNDINMINENTGIVLGYIGDTNSFLTTNGGNSWNYYKIGKLTNQSYLKSNFLNLNTGFITSTQGNIYKSTNTGVNIINISSVTPENFELYQNYPNPFNSTTIIKFDIRNKDKYSLKIYNILGQVIIENNFRNLEPGEYQYNLFLENYSSGIYFYELSSNNYQKIKNMILIK